MKLYALYAAIIFSAISASVMGFFLFKQLNISLPTLSLSLPTFLKQSDYAIQVNASKEWVEYNDTRPTRSPDQIQVLNAPNDSANETDRKNYVAYVGTLAKSSKKLNLSSCYPSPVAIKIKNKSQITVTNSSNSQHTLHVNNTRYAIPAKGEKIITLTFSKIPGVYDFSCDDLKEPVGVFYIE